MSIVLAALVGRPARAVGDRHERRDAGARARTSAASRLRSPSGVRGGKNSNEKAGSIAGREALVDPHRASLRVSAARQQLGGRRTRRARPRRAARGGSARPAIFDSSQVAVAGTNSSPYSRAPRSQAVEGASPSSARTASRRVGDERAVGLDVRGDVVERPPVARDGEPRVRGRRRGRARPGTRRRGRASSRRRSTARCGRAGGRRRSAAGARPGTGRRATARGPGVSITDHVAEVGAHRHARHEVAVGAQRRPPGRCPAPRRCSSQRAQAALRDARLAGDLDPAQQHCSGSSSERVSVLVVRVQPDLAAGALGDRRRLRRSGRRARG